MLKTSQGGATEAEAQVCLLSSEWSFSSVNFVGIVFEKLFLQCPALHAFSAPIANE